MYQQVYHEIHDCLYEGFEFYRENVRDSKRKTDVSERDKEIADEDLMYSVLSLSQIQEAYLKKAVSHEARKIRLLWRVERARKKCVINKKLYDRQRDLLLERKNKKDDRESTWGAPLACAIAAVKGSVDYAKPRFGPNRHLYKGDR